MAEDDQDLSDRAEHWVDRGRSIYEDHGRIFRSLWVAVGVIVVLAGIAMIVVPGPVTVVVPFGLAMLSVAFGWARRLLLVSVEKGEEAKDRMEDASTTAKVLGGVATVSLAAAAVAATVMWWL